MRTEKTASPTSSGGSPLHPRSRVALYRANLEVLVAPLDWPNPHPDDVEDWQARVAEIEELRGHDLACWCPLDQACHADVLLELANR